MIRTRPHTATIAGLCAFSLTLFAADGASDTGDLNEEKAGQVFGNQLYSP